jgi:8-oxo-dGTP diphosphatase
MQDLRPYFNAAVSANCVVFGFDGHRWQVLVIERVREPYRGVDALPGRLLLPDEGVEEVALQAVTDVTGVGNPYHKEVRAFGGKTRHPAGRVVSVAWYAFVRMDEVQLRESAIAVRPRWYALDELPPMAFDHNEIVRSALRRVRKRLRNKPVALELLPPKFTLPQLHRLYEDLYRTEIDKRNFRRKILASGIFVPLDEYLENGQNRPPRLYVADPARYHDWRKNRSQFAPDL